VQANPLKIKAVVDRELELRLAGQIHLQPEEVNKLKDYTRAETG